ncbi:endonuclease [Corynebacterium sp. Q4381]|uniref:endonuclease n=1 Tax=Corynebacterium sp. Marseille-Q4381 TaxID=3121597 RepID=UPI002FE5BAC1
MVQTFAEEAGISLDSAPAPLFQLLTLCLLQAKPIRADVATAAARALFDAGLTTPEAMRDAPRSTLIRIFGQNGYKRYDESTATRLHAFAAKLIDEYGGDLRELRDGAPASLEVFDGVGPACATMFAREAQGVWPELAPVFDKKALAGAQSLGLPADPEALAARAEEEGVDLPHFAAKLVRKQVGGSI